MEGCRKLTRRTPAGGAAAAAGALGRAAPGLVRLPLYVCQMWNLVISSVCTYMKDLLTNEITIMKSQLGRTVKIQKKYPTGLERPNWWICPSKGWK